MSTPLPDPSSVPPAPHVLLVDDDPQIRSLLETALGSSGFRVSVAPCGEEAVAIYRQDGSIGVVLLDVQMPGLSGPETLAALRRHNPNVPALFMSGGTGGYSPAELEALSAGRVLAKPFRSLAEVAEALRRAARG